MQPGESVAVPPPLAKVSLDYNDPESCIFLIEKSVWNQETDPGSGQAYFVNEETGATQWEVPTSTWA